MNRLFVSKDVYSNSLEFIDQAMDYWSRNAQTGIHIFPDADITIVTRDSGIYLMSKRKTFRKKVPFIAMAPDATVIEFTRESCGSGIVLKEGDAEVDFMNAILAKTTN